VERIARKRERRADLRASRGRKIAADDRRTDVTRVEFASALRAEQAGGERSRCERDAENERRRTEAIAAARAVGNDHFGNYGADVRHAANERDGARDPHARIAAREIGAARDGEDGTAAERRRAADDRLKLFCERAYDDERGDADRNAGDREERARRPRAQLTEGEQHRLRVVVAQRSSNASTDDRADSCRA